MDKRVIIPKNNRIKSDQDSARDQSDTSKQSSSVNLERSLSKEEWVSWSYLGGREGFPYGKYGSR